jgi:tRNA nucleotidyltransferase (CCA-adding enzyme)
LTDQAKWPAHHGHEEAGVALVRAFCDRLPVPGACRDLAVLMTRHHTRIHTVENLRVASMVSLMRNVDAFRRPARFQELLQACACDAQGRLGMAATPYPQQEVWAQALAVAKAVDVGAFVRATGQVPDLAQRIHGARVQAVKAAFALPARVARSGRP